MGRVKFIAGSLLYNDERYLILHTMKGVHIVFETYVTDEVVDIKDLTFPIKKMNSVGPNKSNILQVDHECYKVGINENNICEFIEKAPDSIVAVCFVPRELYNQFYKRNKEYSDKISVKDIDPCKSSTYLLSIYDDN